MIGSRAITVASRAVGGVVAAAVLCVAVSGTAFAARGGSSAGTCQRDGWTVAQTSTGSTFRTKDACLVYVRTGGTIYKPAFWFDPGAVIQGQEAKLHVTGFHPNSTGTLTQHLLGGSGATLSFLNVPTDANGNMAVIGTVFNDPSCSNGVYGAEWTFVDAYGVHAGATVTLICFD